MPNWLSVEELIEEGYLQEANRRFFHPLGLALALRKSADGTTEIAGIIDSREDPEGFIFGDEPDETAIARARRVNVFWKRKAIRRMASLGYVIQPILPEEKNGHSK